MKYSITYYYIHSQVPLLLGRVVHSSKPRPKALRLQLSGERETNSGQQTRHTRQTRDKPSFFILPRNIHPHNCSMWKKHNESVPHAHFCEHFLLCTPLPPPSPKSPYSSGGFTSAASSPRSVADSAFGSARLGELPSLVQGPSLEHAERIGDAARLSLNERCLR